MSKSKRDFGDMVDDIIDNPAYEMLGGYHIFLRRIAIPIILLLIAMVVYDLTKNQLATGIITGLALGPVLGLERALAEWQIRK
ncbi:MAG TPA: hypothetical protein EYQ07_04670 [Candidatus Poseidoniales archaeon]|jgi:hypothetical protein|nr:hypothetical protein [Candidatus Poseidoniales archaeon]HIL50072.1 hypothetical protein [Candidatus Poseidoniales archaeon]